MKKRVCFISLLAYPLFNAQTANNVIGGAEINMVLLARKLSEDPHYEVSFLVDDYGQPPMEIHQGIRVLKYKGGAHCNNALDKLLRAFKDFHQMVTLNADIFIYTTANSFLGKLVLIEKSLRRKKVIFRLSSDRNLDFSWYRKAYGRKFMQSYLYGLIRSSHIVCQTDKQSVLLKKSVGLSGNVIPNGFPPRETIDVTQKRTILWVSRCLPLKNPLLFLELAERLPEEKFVMIMPQNDSGNCEINEQINSLTQTVQHRATKLQNVMLMDYVPYEVIQVYFDQAKGFVCTSSLEGFPNTFIQACLGGTAILSFYTDPDNMIVKNDLGLVCGDDLDAAVGFIRGLKDEKLEYYRQKTFDYVNEHHQIDHTVQMYQKLFQD